jgi:transcriptional regulator with XRE-family HTH domain
VSTILESVDAAAINSRIGAEVRRRRIERRLSLDALASLCGVSRSNLSLIERGESNPTAVVLCKIAAAFGVPLGDLLGARGASPVEQPLTTPAQQSVWRDPASGYVRRSLSPRLPRLPFELVEITLPPRAHIVFDGGQRASGLHHQLWVLEGAVEVTIGTETHALGTGDCLAFIQDRPTGYRNPSRKPVRYLLAIATEGVR